ncbi:Pal1 cell morphology protein-domain-containing protein [Phellopilus nigrolimitatus]|nr:Pal1 cell morphology protein-domain-containing protein [Phellopilus nigrolimitatus]
MPSSTNPHRSSHSSRPVHQRARSSSDPFLDPIYPAPHLSYDNSYPRSAQAPQVPPKQVKKSTRHYDTRDHRMLEAAVRDTVTVRTTDQSPRAKISRSQTGGVQTSASGSKHAPPTSRRSYSQDSVTQSANAAEKARKSGKPAKKGSSHADVIDRLDFTGVGPMFHHDGPFDACAPSRNRHKSKAPMMAWTSADDDSRMSAAQFRADRRLAAVDTMGGGHYDSPYPTVGYPSADHDGQPKNPKQVDRIAEAWGIHEPEPYEEFFGGGGGDASAPSSIRGGNESHTQNGRPRAREGWELRETYLDEGKPRPARRPSARNMPPPQPINLPGANGEVVSPPLSSPGHASSPGAPKRSKSLMQKIRKMRDAPNVPVDSAQVGDDYSPPSSIENYASAPVDGGRSGRPAHRHQNSFFGRFGRNASAHAGHISPTDSSDHYVYVEKAPVSNKALPPRPAETPPSNGYEKDGYFDGPSSPGETAVSPGGGMARKTSILRKVKGVVRGGGNR